MRDRHRDIHEYVDRPAVDRQDAVAASQSRGFGCRPGHDLARDRRRGRRSDERRETGEDQDREQKVGDRPRRHDQRALPHRLRGKGVRPLVGGQRLPFGVGLADRVAVARELDIAAERQPADLPLGAAFVGPAEDLAPETDREGVGLHPAPAADDIMPIFVHEDERPEDEQETDEIEPERHIMHVRKGPQIAARPRAMRHRR